jgi:hypothetical protein
MLMATLNCRAAIFQSDSSTAINVPQSSFWAEPQIEHLESVNINLIARTGASRTSDITTPLDTSRDDATAGGEGVALDKESLQLVG